MGGADFGMVADSAECRSQVVFVHEDVVIGVGYAEIEDARENAAEGGLVVDGWTIMFEVDVRLHGSGIGRTREKGDGSLTCRPLILPFLRRLAQPIAARKIPSTKRKIHRRKVSA